MTSDTSGADAAMTDVQRGLRMAHPPDPAKLAAERAHLAALEHAGAGRRIACYLRLSGPGYLQSAMTLGSGTAVNSLLAGALFGYTLLWVAPVAMLLGVIMLSAISYQTLSTGMRPFEAMRTFAGPFFAWGWAIGAILSSIIWHFPQYALAAAVLDDLGRVAGMEWLEPQWLGFVVLAWAIVLSFMYGASPLLVRVYERVLKYMIWGVVLCFAWVVWCTGVSDVGALLRGFFTFRIPSMEQNGVAAGTLVLGGLAAAVGVNMVFLYPYSLLARGWGREHRRLARFDLFTGMFIPYLLASSLMLIAAANTIHLDPSFTASKVSVLQMAQALADLPGEHSGRIIFGLGVLGMTLSTITLHMIVVGFVCSEWFGWKVGGMKYRLASLVPVIGVFGPLFWSENSVWLAVPTSILCGFLLPIAYVGFILLQRSRRYLGADLPGGVRGGTWLGSMIAITLFFVVFLGWYVIEKGPGYAKTITEMVSPSAVVESGMSGAVPDATVPDDPATDAAAPVPATETNR